MVRVDALTNIAVMANQLRCMFALVVSDEAGPVGGHVLPFVGELSITFVGYSGPDPAAREWDADRH